MSTKWTAKDLQNLQSKGIKHKIQGEVSQPQKKAFKTKTNGFAQKQKIENFLMFLEQRKFIDGYELEYRFDPNRRFRFDWAIPSLMIGIEFEGVMSEKSRHTTVTGYTGDCNKYNRAATLGWKVFRYTALNVESIFEDFKQLLDK
jgi:hypothetical protein